MTAPNFDVKDTYPMGGVKIGPAWQAAWDAMADHTWKTNASLIEVMVRAAEVTPRTAHNLLTGARAAGRIEVRYRKFGDSQRVRIHSYRRKSIA